ncbi:MAG TPA: DNA-3-methyladenine glycosylase [Candidatus Bathyarchaeia archaeon]|nr:DNA-3-methyladenine glycosylase [Candidatus Bathyarchaeia archaeon]
MSAHATRHLSKVDPVMRALIRRVGPCGLAVRNQQPFETLVRAVAHQQIHGRAAEAILGRFVALFPGRRFPSPAAVAATPATRMRRAGFSRGKIRAIKDIARKARDGHVPTRRACHALSDEELIERLTALRGVGRWTVEMLLLFTLGRPDVLPVDDFGVREGFKRAYGRRKQPTPKQLRRHGERWKPYRSVAAWYLWRATEQALHRKVQPKIT